MLSYNGLAGTLPTELGTLTALTVMCVHRPHPPRLDACTAVVGLWAECGGMGESRDIEENSLTSTVPTELGSLTALRRLCVPSPTVSGRVRRCRCVG